MPYHIYLCSSNDNFDANTVKKIISHPQAFGQCNNWLRENFPFAEKLVATSTAEAASKAKEDSSLYCIANSHAIEIFDLNNHFENIQDRSDNKTRFLGYRQNDRNEGEINKTSLMINIKDQPGSLMKILKPFSELNINMTRIETRPSRNNIFLHTFY